MYILASSPAFNAISVLGVHKKYNEIPDKYLHFLKKKINDIVACLVYIA